MTVGLVGVGQLGERLRLVAKEMGCSVLLCDPPRNAEEIDDLKDQFFALWGNGMGGCQLTGEELEAFLPLDCLKRVDLLSIQVPLVKEGLFPTYHMITSDFLQGSNPAMQILCLSDTQVFAPDALHLCQHRLSLQQNFEGK